MPEPSSPINGQSRVVEGLVTTGGVPGYKKGGNASAVAGSAYQALDTIIGGAGTAGTAAPDVVTTQGIAGGTPMPISAASLPLPTGAATAANQPPLGAALSAASLPVVLATDGTVLGPVTETAPATDTASSGLNGRLQRIAQRLTSLIALLPAALGGGGGLKVEGVGTTGTPAGGVVTTQGAAGGSAQVVSQTTSIIQTPTITAASAYASGNAVGGLLTFANAARSSGKGTTITGMVITDTSMQDVATELWLFDQTFTAMTDKTAWAPSAADLLHCVGVLTSGAYANGSANSVSTRYGAALSAVPAATSLYGQLVTRGTPTYAAASALQVRLLVVPD